MAEGKIENISTFCDEWCERCAFTSRCQEYVPGRKSLRDKLVVDPKLTARLRANLEKATELFQKVLQVTGIDFQQAKDEVQTAAESSTTLAGKNLLALSGAYAALTTEWLKSQPGMIERLRQMITDLTIGTETPDEGRRTTEAIKNELSVINWYVGVIQIRILESGLLVQAGATEDFMVDDDRGLKSDGVAKAALYAMDRSLQAWQFVFDLLPDREDDLLKILSQLQKLRGATIEAFPNALAFRRPGFDD